MLPVPLIKTVFAIITKQDAPLADLLTAALNVTFEFGMYTKPVKFHVGLLPAYETSTPVVKLGSW